LFVGVGLWWGGGGGGGCLPLTTFSKEVPWLLGGLGCFYLLVTRLAVLVPAWLFSCFGLLVGRVPE
jgi:hypothetical protein